MQAIGGSTNGLVHLTAAAGRLGIKIDLAEFDQLGRDVPVLLDLKPSGRHYMEHFHWAGGVPALAARARRTCIDLDAPTVMGGTLRDYVEAAENVPGQDVIRSRAAPIKRGGQHGGAARQPGAARRHHQAVGGVARADEAQRPRGGVRLGART